MWVGVVVCCCAAVAIKENINLFVLFFRRGKWGRRWKVKFCFAFVWIDFEVYSARKDFRKKSQRNGSIVDGVDAITAPGDVFMLMSMSFLVFRLPNAFSTQFKASMLVTSTPKPKPTNPFGISSRNLFIIFRTMFSQDHLAKPSQALVVGTVWTNVAWRFLIIPTNLCKSRK